VGQLPQKEDGEKYPRPGVETLGHRRPAHHRWNGTRHGTDHGGQGADLFERGVDKDIAGERRGAEQRGQQIDTERQLHQAGNRQSHPEGQGEVGMHAAGG
jgi:hypothetical protein